MNYKKFENKSSAKYGRFGDNASNGGRVVKGINNDDIHIEGGIESDIWTTYSKQSPELAENILAARKGITPSEASINPFNENREYFKNPFERVGEWVGSTATDFVGAGMDFLGDLSDIPGNVLGQAGALWDQYAADPFQQKFEIGEYDPENIMKDQLGDMIDPSIGSVVSGTKSMKGFLGEQYEGQKDMLALEKGANRAKVGNLQDRVGSAYQGAVGQSAKTNLVTSTAGLSNTMENIEKSGKSEMSSIGREMKSLDFQGNQLFTQLEIDKLKADQQASAAIQTILGDYMAATGEPISDEYMSLLDEINTEGSVDDLENYS